MRPAFSVLTKTLEAFTANVPTSSYSNVAAIIFPQIHEYLRQYQDPKNADAIMRVQQELDETKVVLHKTIESVLARGEKLDDLVDRSQTLSNTSKQFFKTAKKVTSCFLNNKSLAYTVFLLAKLVLCGHVDIYDTYMLRYGHIPETFGFTPASC